MSNNFHGVYTINKVWEGFPNKFTLAQHFPLTTLHPLFPWRWCINGMMVEGKDYRFNTFQAWESLLVAERVTFPVKMLQDGVSEHNLHFACTRRSSYWICPAKPFTPVLTRDKVRSCSVLYRRKAAPCSENLFSLETPFCSVTPYSTLMQIRRKSGQPQSKVWWISYVWSALLHAFIGRITAPALIKVVMHGTRLINVGYVVINMYMEVVTAWSYTSG